MHDYPAFAPTQEQAHDLLLEQRVGRLVTNGDDGWPRIGLYVYTHVGLTIEIHLVGDDPQLADVRRSPRAVFEVDEVLANAPSYWNDDGGDASHADQFYRTVTIRGDLEIIADPSEIIRHLNALLRRHQDQGRHLPLALDVPVYAVHLGRLNLVRLHGSVAIGKLKLAQRTNPEARKRIIEGLRSRGSALDVRTAELIVSVNEKQR